ncbi:hypothetical protein F5888DRAFT_1808856 [Russula emetica]|nr:hypothetical protein F5888DRAFT_1808856 [Russula emetica]
MPPRVYFVPGIVLLFCAFILSLLVAISLPNLPTLDIVRCRFTTTLDALPYLLSDTSFGVWGERACGSFIDGADSKTGGFAQIIRLPGKFSFVSIKLEPGRLAAGTGYSFTFSSESDDPAIVGPSPTRGLVAHPVGTSLFSVKTDFRH